jgi:NADPH2 dehydrogenase
MLKMLTPFKFGSLQLKNRIVMAPMCMYSSDDTGRVMPFHESHYTARAYGGVSLVILEATSVEKRGRISPNDLCLDDDQLIDGYRSLVKRIHEAGSLVAIQLAHAGRKSMSPHDTPIAPSHIAFPGQNRPINEMTNKDILDVIQSFSEAARRAQTAGFDGIEIHGAHGYLINQFLSPLANFRQDEYGGNLNNRVRFLKDILEAVHQQFKGDIWVRLSVEEYAEGGHHINDTLQVIEIIKPLITGVNVSSGGVVPVSIDVKPGYQLPFAQALHEQGIMTIGGGLIKTVEEIEEALSKSTELVFLGRELLLNPYFVLQVIKKHQPELMYPAYKRG